MNHLVCLSTNIIIIMQYVLFILIFRVLFEWFSFKGIPTFFFCFKLAGRLWLFVFDQRLVLQKKTFIISVFYRAFEFKDLKVALKYLIG